MLKICNRIPLKLLQTYSVQWYQSKLRTLVCCPYISITLTLRLTVFLGHFYISSICTFFFNTKLLSSVGGTTRRRLRAPLYCLRWPVLPYCACAHMPVQRNCLPFGCSDAGWGGGTGLGGPLEVPSSLNGSVVVWRLMSAQYTLLGCAQSQLHDATAPDQQWGVPSSLYCGLGCVQLWM